MYKITHLFFCRFTDSTAKELLTSPYVFLMLVGPNSYDSEIAEESNEHLLVNRVSSIEPFLIFPFYNSGNSWMEIDWPTTWNQHVCARRSYCPNRGQHS